MKFFNFLKKQTVDNNETSNKTNEALYSEIIKNAEMILANSNENESELHPIFSFIKQLTDLITAETAMNSYVKGLRSDVNTQTILEGRYSTYSSSLIKHIELSSSKEDFLFTDVKNCHCYYYPGEITVNLKNFPLILNPWNSDRISLRVMGIANIVNPFDKNKHSDNINNGFYYPVGVAQCFGGNHSQYSAKLKGAAETSLNSIHDISELYNYISFNGTEFKYDYPNEDIKIYPQYIAPENILQFYLGILFEIGRLLLQHPNVFPNDIMEALDECKKI